MSIITNKIDFAALISAKMANPNGDPLNGNRPRTDYNGFGEISDVCIKRKIRNRMQDMREDYQEKGIGYDIFVKSDERADDGYKSLSDRASTELKGINNKDEYAEAACAKWLDVRSFGQVFAFASKNKGKKKESEKESSVSVGVRGPVSLHQAVSLSPVEVQSMQITKSVNSETKDDGSKSSDTMGEKHFIRFGLYLLKGSINVQLAEKTGFSEDDADIIKECLRTLFLNDASSARPEGSMEVCRLYWWKHNCKDGQYSSAKVHRSLKAKLKEGVDVPSSVDDYEITLDELPGLEPEVIKGV
ncbi:MAG: type I-C CRISPR-associated protein Cas7/Csd2 [Eubacteriales bacterium]|jgi:CRISPR-associated protein Csd2